MKDPGEEPEPTRQRQSESRLKITCIKLFLALIIEEKILIGLNAGD